MVSGGRVIPRHIFVMKRDGSERTQITSHEDTSWEYEHVVLSPDGKRIVANYRVSTAGNQSRSKVIVYDLEKQQSWRLVPKFIAAGDGGLDWDQEGYVYFPGARTETPPDLYKIRTDGTGLTRLTTSANGDFDVSTSRDGLWMTWARAVPDASGGFTELWVARTDGTEQTLVYTSGTLKVSSAHDPEIFDNNQRIVFSRFNVKVPANYPDQENTAHDVLTINRDGTGLTTVTPEGGLQAIPDGHEDGTILYTDANELDSYRGLATIKQDGTARQRIGSGAFGKWIQ